MTDARPLPMSSTRRRSPIPDRMLRMGIARGVLLVTTISVLLSVVLTVLLINDPGFDQMPTAVAIAVAVPLLVAPPMTLFTLRLAHELDASRKLVQRLAVTDELTGAYNRRFFWEHVAHLESANRRVPQPVALIMLDIDNFKAVNDVAGHRAGDEILRAFSAALKAQLRADDALVRLGGDEFVVVVSGVSSAQALSIAERLRGAVIGLKLPRVVGAGPYISASIGVAMAGGGGEALFLDKLLLQADAAVYAAKSAGRNRIELVQVPAPAQAASQNQSEAGILDARSGA